MSPPPGLEPLCDLPTGALLKMLVTMDTQPHKVYPLKPPGIFKCDHLGYESTAASTAASDMGDESDAAVADATQMSDLVNMAGPVGLVNADCKKASHEMQVVPLGSAGGQPCSVLWPVDAKKLKGKDKQIVSPSFEVLPGCWFKLFLKPKIVGEKGLQRGQATLSKGKGWGSAELKCVEGAALAPALSFKLSVGAGVASGPIEHDFKESTVCVLPKQGGYFDFASAVDSETMTFLVSLEAVPVGAADISENACF